MGEYFRPWQRKIGVLVLMVACLFAAGWVRGLRTRHLIDTGRYIPGSRGIVIDSKDHSLTIMSRSGDVICLMPDGQLQTIVIASNQTVALERIIKIHYWIIVVPLTLLSAWLLLSKPRAGKHASPVEPRTIKQDTLF
jgi:hypothetical protein